MSERILQFGPYPENPEVIRGGIEASIHGLCKELSKDPANSVKVLNYPNKSLKQDKRFINNNIEVVHFSNPWRFDGLALLCWFKIVREIRKFKPSVCHLHGTSNLVLFLLLYLKLTGVKHIVTVHGILTVEQQNIYKKDKNLKTLLQLWFYSFFEFVTLNICSTIIVDTEYVKKWIEKQKLVLRKPKIYTIPQGIDEIFFNIPDNRREEVLVSVGSIQRRKGYEYSISAIKPLTQKYPDLKYNIIGVRYDEQYYNELQQHIKELNLEEQVNLLPDMKREEVYNYLGEANVFLLHSQEESQGIVFCEAMAAGKPIVATNVGGIPDVVKNDYNGFLSSYKDVNTFSDNIDRVINCRKTRSDMSDRNRADAQRYLWSSIAGEVTSIYKSL